VLHVRVINHASFREGGTRNGVTRSPDSRNLQPRSRIAKVAVESRHPVCVRSQLPKSEGGVTRPIGMWAVPCITSNSPRFLYLRLNYQYQSLTTGCNCDLNFAPDGPLIVIYINVGWVILDARRGIGRTAKSKNGQSLITHRHNKTWGGGERCLFWERLHQIVLSADDLLDR
jgi:hypothetical protein